MGPLGWQETVFIFFLALLLFGPKKLPELGRTIGKAMTEFRRASNELKATFDREMKTLEQETDFKELKEVTNQYQYDTYNYDYSSYEGSTTKAQLRSRNYDARTARIIPMPPLPPHPLQAHPHLRALNHHQSSRRMAIRPPFPNPTGMLPNKPSLAADSELTPERTATPNRHPRRLNIKHNE